MTAAVFVTVKEDRHAIISRNQSYFMAWLIPLTALLKKPVLADICNKLRYMCRLIKNVWLDLWSFSTAFIPTFYTKYV